MDLLEKIRQHIDEYKFRGIKWQHNCSSVGAQQQTTSNPDLK